MASWVRKTSVRLRENWDERQKSSKMRLKVLICRCELVFCFKCEPVGAEPEPLLSWEGGCSLGGLQCIRRRWWRTWPPPPQLGWQLGRQGTCPALCLAGREEKKTASIYMSAFFSSLHPCVSCFFSCSSSVASPLISIHLLRIMQNTESLEWVWVNLFCWHLLQTTN